MANVKVPLTVKEVEQLKAPGVHSVGGFPGLCLQVTPPVGDRESCATRLAVNAKSLAWAHFRR